MEEKEMVWLYQNKEFTNKKDLIKYFNLSTCKFEAKVKANEIIKIKQQAFANENNSTNCI